MYSDEKEKLISSNRNISQQKITVICVLVREMNSGERAGAMNPEQGKVY